MTGFQGERVLTVSQFNAVVKMVLDNEPLLKGVTVTGELSGVKKYPSGHIYFTLKDEGASLSCVMFSSNAAGLKFQPAEGMQVKLRGAPALYERDGRFQFIARSMESDGAGGLYAAYEKLKSKLEKQGLFDEANKKPLPAFPKRIGVITSPSGAAFHDILNVTARRFPGADILLDPAAVQGAEAPAQLRAGVRYFDKKRLVDVLIIGRGGGSMEDLWAFNDEGLARDIFLCRVPVISAVGHETDFTICDFVADKRAPTPSAAAELAVPDKSALLLKTARLEERMTYAMKKSLEERSSVLAQLSKSRALTDKSAVIDAKRERLQGYGARLLSASGRLLEKKEGDLRGMAGALAGLNPMSILARGYSAVFNHEGRVVSSVEQIEEHAELSLRFGDGSARVRVLDVQRKEERHE
ncbi:MAG: exodeoxyribonuclease VII large subunit [Clostridia bacterium]|nr:exodeoxyribonuclease VII large subunit [Clostridia bacterium]